MTGREVTQVTTWESADAATLWRKSAAHRAAYMATTTAALLDMAGVTDGARVLAVGCGTGEEAFAAAARVGPTGQVVGTDLSAAMIEVATGMAAESRTANVSFKVMDTQRLELQSGSFDAVIARNSIMFVPDLQRALAEMRRVLRPSGRAGVSVWSSAAHNPRIAGPLAAAKALGANPPESSTYRVALRLGRPPVLATALRRAGFHDVQVKLVALTAPYADLAEAVNAALEQSGTRELVGMLPAGGSERMHESLARRWRRFSTRDGIRLPGEQLVAGGFVP